MIYANFISNHHKKKSAKFVRNQNIFYICITFREDIPIQGFF